VKWGYMKKGLNDIRGITPTLLIILVVMSLITTFEEVPISRVAASPKPLMIGGVFILVPRGISKDNVYWRYIYNKTPRRGWNKDINFDDSNWLEGRTPIGEGWWLFSRTCVKFRDLYVRKIIEYGNHTGRVILCIASDDGVEVWVNGYNVLNKIDKMHGSYYWNYKIDITECLKLGKNLIAIHVRNYVGPCYFDSEIIIKTMSLREEIINFVLSRYNPDGGFSEASMDSVWLATSILKAMNSIDEIDEKRTITWIMTHRFECGDFGNGIWWQYPAIESLKNLGTTLTEEDARHLAELIMNWRGSDGTWGGELWVTYYAIKAIASLGMINEVNNWSATIEFIKSLQAEDGGFKNRKEDKHSYVKYTYAAIHSLYLLGKLDVVDREKVINFIMSCYKDYAFSDRPEHDPRIESTFWAVKSLEMLKSLDIIDKQRVIERVLSWQRDEEGIGDPWGDYFLVMTLKALGGLDKLNKKLVEKVLRYYNPLDGSFKFYPSRLHATEHAIRILRNLNALSRLDIKRISEWILAQNFYYWSTGDIHSAVVSLKELGMLDEIKSDLAKYYKITREILKHQNPDGGFGPWENENSNLWETYVAIDTLALLNATSEVDKEKVTKYLLSLRNNDGSFNYSSTEKGGLRATALAVITLCLLGERRMIEEKTIEYILKRQCEDGRFGNIMDTFFALKALELLHKLNDDIVERATKYALSLQNLDGGFGSWKGDVWSWLYSTNWAVGIIYYNKVSITIRTSTLLTLEIIAMTEAGDHISTKVEVDEKYIETTPIIISVVRGEHIVSIKRIVSGDGAIRYVFNKWALPSNYVKEPVNIEHNATLKAIYKKQYFVSVLSEYGNPLGTGWYDEGSLALVKVENLISLFPGGIIPTHVFEGWYDEYGNKVSENSEYRFKVTKPIKLYARWKTIYSPLITTMVLSILVITSVIAIAALSYKRKARVKIEVKRQELRRYEGYLVKLEELKAQGRISQKAYEILKAEYEEKIKEIKERMTI